MICDGLELTSLSLYCILLFRRRFSAPPSRSPASAVQSFRKKNWTAKNENFFHSFLISRAHFFFLKGMEKFSVLERKFLQNLRAEAGRRRKNQNSQSGFSLKKVRISFSKHRQFSVSREIDLFRSQAIYFSK